MSAYYNEHDKFNVAWLEHLMEAGLIALGEIDGRDIQDVRADDLRGFTQCHFFAGIGVWSYALRCAGWKDTERCWSGSCPCQPFSVSGLGRGASDERHLWPVWFPLIRESRPVICFGEQVASDDGLAWLDLVSADLEGQDYTVGAVDTPACGFGAPHRRQRLYWVADADGRRREQRDQSIGAIQLADQSHAADSRRGGREDGSAASGDESKGPRSSEPERTGQAGWLDESSQSRLERHAGDERDGDEPGRLNKNAARSVTETGSSGGFWSAADWLWCRDEKYRPVEPGTFPLAHGVKNRVGLLRGYGNALVAPQAEGFIRAVMEELCQRG